MKISQNAKTVLEKRYLKRNAKNQLAETVEGLFLRVAKAVAEADKKYNKKADVESLAKSFYDLMTNLDFLPNSPTLMNAGRPLGQLSACFVLPIEDNMEGIFEAVKNAALIHKSGGGTGFSFSRLRSKGAVVTSTGGQASGPVSFMRVFNMATEAVKQGGTRRGANMGILRVDHPDILDFIDCKKDITQITNFNISVGITEKFMKAVAAEKEFELIEPSTKKVVKKLNAREVFNKIVDNAWLNGEPGIIFLDRLNEANVVPTLGEIEATNPCGEQPLLPYESCNLGSINLANMLKAGKGGKLELDTKKLKQTVELAVHFLDNVIEVNQYPLDKIREVTLETRKIGLGVMGFADMLLQLEIPYNSKEAIELAKKVMKQVQEDGRAYSAKLAKTRGAFPAFEVSVFKGGAALRNATITTIAPTGTLSILASCSSGIEPIFAYAYIKNVMDGTHLLEVNPYLKAKLKERGIYSDALMKQVIEQGTLAYIKEIPADIKKVFVSTHDISPEAHIKMQAAFQQFTDNAVSKTINFTKDATRTDVEKSYKLAYEQGLKGITIYRDGSRTGQVLNVGSVNDGKAASERKDCAECKQRKNGVDGGVLPRLRPSITRGFTEKVKIGCGNLYITVNFDDDGIVEVFTSTGKSGGCPSQSEATARVISVALRAGVDFKSVVKQVKSIRCPSTVRMTGLKVTSCPDAIAKTIEKVAQSMKKTSKLLPEDVEAIADDNGNKNCPDCKTKLEQGDGCVLCRACGYSKCG